MTFASEVEVLNMSLSGVALRSDRRLAIGHDYQLRIVNEGGRGLTLQGVVVWCSLESRRKNSKGDDILIYSAGLRFAGLISEGLASLMGFLDDHKVHPEQRTGGTRFEIEATGRALLEVPHPFRVRVLSLTGMLVHATASLDLGTVLPMELSLHAGDPLRFEGRVAYCTEVDLEGATLYEIGVEFVRMPPDDRNRLEAFVEELKNR